MNNQEEYTHKKIATFVSICNNDHAEGSVTHCEGKGTLIDSY